MHRMPAIAGVNDRKDRALVRLVTHGVSGSLQGTSLDAPRDGEWGVPAGADRGDALQLDPCRARELAEVPGP